MFRSIDKRNGAVMEITAYRVSGEKQPRQSKVYIGKMNEQGVFVPNKLFIERSKKEELKAEVAKLQEELDALKKGEKKQKNEVEALTAVVSAVSGKKKTGLTHALGHIATAEGFVPALVDLFGEKPASQILSLSYYVLATKNEALDDFSYFDASHVHPYGFDISSSESSAILASITAEHVNGFFKAIRDAGPTRSKEDHFCAFDGTAFSSYSNDLSEVEVSKGKQDPDLKHFAMAAVYSSHEGRCAYYRLYRGNIPDIKTIDNFVDVSKAMGFNFRRIVLDRGYCSFSNLYRLHHECRYDVIMCLKSNMGVYKDALASVRGTFEDDCTRYLCDHEVYGTTVRHEIVLTDAKDTDHPTKVFVHVYHDKMKEADQEPKLYGELEDSIADLTNRVRDKELSVEDASKRLFACKQKSLVTVRKTGNSACVFEMDCKAVDEARGRLGYFMLLGTEDLTAGRALDIYRAKDGVERVFNNAKNDIGFDRPAVKTDATLEGKVFIIMLAGMISTHIRNAMRSHREELTRKMTYHKLLKELECMYTFGIKGKTTWCEISERQALVLKCLGVPLPVDPKQVQAKLKKKRGPKPKTK
jgi:transposase